MPNQPKTHRGHEKHDKAKHEIISQFALKHFKLFAMLGIINVHGSTLLIFSSLTLPVVLSYDLLHPSPPKKINIDIPKDFRAII